MTENSRLVDPNPPAWAAMRQNQQAMIALSGGGGGNTSDPMESRVKALEGAFSDMRVTLARMEAKLDTLATKDDVHQLSERVTKVEATVFTKENVISLVGRLENVEGRLRGTLSFWQFLGVVGALLAIILRWPELFRLAGVTP